MKYKLIALDLDGTIVNSDNRISDYTLNTLNKLRQKGVLIVISTGRSYSSLKPLVKDLNIVEPVICYNGAMIRDGKSDEIILNSTVPDDVSRELIRLSREKNLHFHGFMNGNFNYERESERSREYQELSGLSGNIVDFDNIENLNFTKCMFIGENEKLLDIEKITRPLTDRCYIAFSKPTFLEIMNVEASKGRALEKLSKELGIKREEIIAFGDGLNDEDMLEFAGLGVAMLNGYDSLKARFKTTEYTHNDDGVARYLQELFVDQI